MSVTVNGQPKPVTMRGAVSDQHALVQVEKWMAAIREIGCEPRSEYPGLIETEAATADIAFAATE